MAVHLKYQDEFYSLHHVTLQDEELDDEQVERKNKRKCDRPTIVQSPAKSLSSRHSPVKTPLRFVSISLRST